MGKGSKGGRRQEQRIRQLEREACIGPAPIVDCRNGCGRGGQVYSSPYFGLVCADCYTQALTPAGPAPAAEPAHHITVWVAGADGFYPVTYEQAPLREWGIEEENEVPF